MFKNNNSIRSSNLSRDSLRGSLILPASLEKFTDVKDSNESEVISNIVMEKFRNILNYYYQRSFTRLRKKSSDNTSLDDDNINSIHTVKTLPLTKHEGLLINHEESLTHRSNPELVSREDTYFSARLTSLKSSTGSLPKMATQELQQIDDNGVFVENDLYDSQEFLRTALGDELYSYPDIDDAGMEKNEVPLSRNSSEKDNTVSTSEISALLSKPESLYNSFSKNIHGSTDLASSPINKQIQNNALPKECMSLDCKATDLIQEAAIQHQIIVQISKALNVCLSLKEFKSSTEYVEAEKILLLAEQRREAVLNELRKADYENVDNLTCKGEVKISNLKFTLAKDPQESETVRWFLAVVSHDTIVLATEVTTPNQEGNIIFEKGFTFTELSTDFEIELAIYTLNIKNDMKNYSHESKFHLKTETTMCPGSRKLGTLYKASNKQPKTRYSYERRHPSFVLWGKTKIHIADLTKAMLTLFHIPECSELQTTFFANFCSSVKLINNYSGFLTIGSEIGGCATWSRRWCQLDGDNLKYWNHPAEQEFSEPIGSIDLRFCVTSYITRVNRELCARPRTLLLEIGCHQSSEESNSAMEPSKHSSAILKYYLSADNLEELNIWKNRLNFVVSSLRNWNSMKYELFKK